MLLRNMTLDRRYYHGLELGSVVNVITYQQSPEVHVLTFF